MPRRRLPPARRLARVALLAAPFAVVALALLRPGAEAGLEGEVYTSREANIRLVVPRGWRVSDLPTYPGILLWMARTKPPGRMLLTVDTIDRDARCAWPKACRDGARPLAEQMACALAVRVEAAGFRPGPVQSGRTPWFDYEDGKRWLRQAVLMSGSRAVTLILSASSIADRANHARSFDRAIRSLRPLTASEAAAVAPVIDAGLPLDGGLLPEQPLDAGVAGDGGVADDGGVPSVTGAVPRDAGADTPDAGAPALAAPTAAAPMEPCPETP
jgi:hypothetical protein